MKNPKPKLYKFLCIFYILYFFSFSAYSEILPESVNKPHCCVYQEKYMKKNSPGGKSLPGGQCVGENKCSAYNDKDAPWGEKICVTYDHGSGNTNCDSNFWTDRSDNVQDCKNNINKPNSCTPVRVVEKVTATGLNMGYKCAFKAPSKQNTRGEAYCQADNYGNDEPTNTTY
jgi:hypothetical protein